MDLFIIEMSQEHRFWLYNFHSFVEQIVHLKKVFLTERVLCKKGFYQIRTIFEKFLQCKNTHDVKPDSFLVHVRTWKMIRIEIIHITKISFLAIYDF